MKIILFCLSILLLAPFAKSQQPVIRNVVFEGAGIRGIAYAGAIGELERRGLLKEIEKVGGTSAGAITALCLSLGYTGDEIEKLLYKTKFARFKDGRFFLFGGINRVKKYYGWYRGEKFTKWLGNIIEKKTGSSETTFEDLSRLGFRELYVTATILNQQRIVILSAKTYPRMKLKDAVRISSSIPFFFEAMFVDSLGRSFRHPKNRAGLDIMIDGGFSGNFPIRIFDSLMTDSNQAAMINPETIGFRIDTEEQIKSDRNGKGLIEMPVNNFMQFGRAFYTMVMENLNRQALSKEDWKRTISISDAGVRPGIRRLSKKEISALMDSGRSATSEFFNP
jgi:NTE family protein